MEEIEALKAIYMDDINIERNERDQPCRLSMQLHPATGDEVEKKFVCITLEIDIPEQYPDELPLVLLKNPRGLGDEEVFSLKKDMMELANERQGGAMLYEMIEMVVDSLTQGNLPRCACTICCEHFMEDDDFTRTNCYHFFHVKCLDRYIRHTLEEKRLEKTDTPAHIQKDDGDVNKVVCPVCREEIECDMQQLQRHLSVEEEYISYTPSAEMVKWQKETAELLEKQRQKGGVINVEEEKNKFLVTEDTIFVPTQQLEKKVDNETENSKHKRDANSAGKGRGHSRYRDHREKDDRKQRAHERYYTQDNRRSESRRHPDRDRQDNRKKHPSDDLRPDIDKDTSDRERKHAGQRNRRQYVFEKYDERRQNNDKRSVQSRRNHQGRYSDSNEDREKKRTHKREDYMEDRTEANNHNEVVGRSGVTNIEGRGSESRQRDAYCEEQRTDEYDDRKMSSKMSDTNQNVTDGKGDKEEQVCIIEDRTKDDRVDDGTETEKVIHLDKNLGGGESKRGKHRDLKSDDRDRNNRSRNQREFYKHDERNNNSGSQREFYKHNERESKSRNQREIDQSDNRERECYSKDERDVDKSDSKGTHSRIEDRKERRPGTGRGYWRRDRFSDAEKGKVGSSMHVNSKKETNFSNAERKSLTNKDLGEDFITKEVQSEKEIVGSGEQMKNDIKNVEENRDGKQERTKYRNDSEKRDRRDGGRYGKSKGNGDYRDQDYPKHKPYSNDRRGRIHTTRDTYHIDDKRREHRREYVERREDSDFGGRKESEQNSQYNRTDSFGGKQRQTKSGKRTPNREYGEDKEECVTDGQKDRNRESKRSPRNDNDKKVTRAPPGFDVKGLPPENKQSGIDVNKTNIPPGFQVKGPPPGLTL